MLLAAGLFGFLASRSIDTAFAAPCANPGTDGPGGTLTGTVDTYYPGTADAASGAPSISVGASRGAATAIAAGDLLLVIQMQDAAINSTDTDSYGNGVAGGTASGSTSVNNSGKFEYVRATSAVVAGSVGISGAGAGSGLLNSYTNAAATATQGQRRFQVVRLPQYSTATLGSGLTAAAWNGTTGGILALDVTGTLALGGATVDVTGLGFRAGGGRQLTGAGGGSNTAYRSLATANYHAQKGEGIAGTPRYVRNGAAAATDTGVEGYPNGSSARGAPGTAGGGGTDGNPAANDQNSGGGGGANGGGGGLGGNTWSSNLARGGYGGTAYAGSVSQLVLGGGGGAGTRNNSPSIPAASAGGNGGGLVMVRAGNLTGTGTITADGQTGVVPQNDAGGGGGAGGSVMVLSAGGGTGGLTVNARGAIGGDAEQATSGAHGPGGGGGGGVVVLSGAAAATNVAGGGAGDTNNGSGTFIAYGATAGSSGTTTTSATLPSVPGTSAGTECTPQLTVTKSTSTPVVVDSGSGGTATYTITVANAAALAAAANTSISDALPSGFTFASTTSVTLSGGATRPSTSNPAVGSATPAWGSFTIPGGGQVQITFTTTIAAGTTPATYQNPATATYTDPARAVAGGTTSASYNPASSTNEDVQVRLPIADVGVTKTVSNATPALNANVTFTVTVTNNGPELARAVSVADALPAGLTFVSATPSVGSYNSGTGVWTVGNLANGANATLSLVATVTTHTLLTNTATASTTSTDPVAGNNASSATVNVPDANLAVTKTVSNATPPVGSNVTFTVTVSNGGPDTAQAASVSDLLPAGLTFVSATPSVGTYNSGTGVWAVGNLANGASATLSLVATVATHTAITNTATAFSSTYDPVSGNDSASASVNAPDANLALTKTVSNATPALNSNVTFTVTVSNGGPDIAQATSVADLLPAGLTFVSATPSVGAYNSGTGVWTVGNLANGASATLSLVATVTTHTLLTNTATASSTTYDPVAGNNAASATVNVPDADLAVTKTVNDPTPALNGNVTFTVTVADNGPDTAQGASVADLLPAGFTFVSATPSVGSYNSGTGVWTVGNLANGASATLSLVATVTTHTLLTNTATASSTTYDPTAANNAASATVNVPDANLAVTKTVSNATPAINSNVTFTVTVSNGGPDTAQAVSVADALPAGLTLVSATPSVGSYAGGTWTVGNLANGASASLTIVATVTTHTLITNTATASSGTYDPAGANNSASATVNVPDANLAVTKTVSNATPAINSNVTFTVTLTNGGPDSATAVAVVDTLPAGLTLVSATPSVGSYNNGTGVWSVGALANGASATLSLVATVTTHTLITNTATASSSTYDPAGANNAASATVNVPDANLAVTKTVNDPTPEIGANVTFTVTVANGGPDTAQAVSVADPLPAGLTFVSSSASVGSYNSGTGTWTVGNLANGAGATLSIVATVTAPGAITNTATASSSTFDPVAGNDSASVSVNARRADLAVAKTVSTATPTLGANVTFTVTVTNNGPDTATGVSVADALPAGLTLVSATPATGSYAAGVWTIGSLANGGSTTLTIVATVTTHTALTNTATASATTYDPTPGNNSASATLNVPDANLAVTKTVNDATPALNSNVTFTVTVTNGGPDTAQSVSVADALPAGLTLVSATPSVGSYAGGVWTVGNLANGASATLQLLAQVTSHVAITNTAGVSSSTYDPAPGNDSASATVNVPDADLSVTKTVDNPTPAINSNVTFTVTLTNGGPNASAGVTVTDPLPAGLTLVSATPSVGSYGAGVWSAGTVANGAVETLVIVATVAGHTQITNTATAAATTFDPVSANNSASASVDVPDADLAVTKTVDNATPGINTNVTFTVTVTNNGPDAAQNVAVADALPAGLTLVSATPSTGTYSSGTGVWTVGTLANGASASLSIVAAVITHTAVTNTATGSSTTYDPTPGNNSGSATVDVPDANLSVTKVVDVANPDVGANVTFTVTVANAGPDTAQAVTVTDVLPAGLSLVSSNPSTGSYNNGTGIWMIGNLANGANATLTIVATVTSHTAVTNTATATSSTFDPASANDSASATVDAKDADLAVTKGVDSATPAVGANVTFTVTVTNTGPNAAQAVAVADALPSGLTFVSATTATGSYSSGTGTWTVGTLANGASATLSLVATVAVPTARTNTATASSSTFDPVSVNNSASASVDARDADLAITKSVDNPTPSFGGQVTFVVTVTNNGPDTSTGVSVADALPAGLSLVGATPSQGSYAAGTWTVGSVPSGANATLAIVAGVTTHTALTNTATVSATTYDPVGANNSASASVDVPDADLTVAKTVNTATPAVGTNVTFTVTLTNNGPNTARAASVADSLPAGLGLVSATPSTGTYNAGTGAWTVGDLANGATATLTIVATVTTYTPVTNTATPSSATYDPVAGNNSASATVDAPDADVSITKSVSNATPALGANVTFTLTVTNNGPNDAATAVSAIDALPAGLTFVSATASTGSYSGGLWTIGTLANGASATLDIVATVTTHTAVTNTATVSSATFDPAPGNNTASASVNVRDADLAVAKTVSNPTPAINSSVTFTVTVTDGGPDAATGASVTDSLPAGLTPVSATPSQGTYSSGTWTVGTLANGASATLTIVATVATHTAITNVATVSATTYDPAPANNSASALLDAPDADLLVTKTVSDATPAINADVSFTVTVTNNGPDTATAVSVADTLPAGLTPVSATPSQGSYSGGVWTVGSLANGVNATLVVTATVTTHTQITNTATASTTTYDPVSSNNAQSASVDVPDADLSVTKTVNNPTPALGSNVTFTVTVTDNGPDAASAVSVADALPAGLTLVSATPSVGTYGGGAWTVGPLANGSSQSLVIVATVTSVSQITNTATASSATYDPVSSNNSRSASVDVRDADLAVTKTVSNPTPALGSNVTFTVTVTNNGPDAAAAVSVADALPAGLTLVSATPSVGSYSAGAWTIGGFGNGASATLTIGATVTSHTQITNTATVSSTTQDTVAANNTASASVDVPNVDLAVTKTVDTPAPPLGSNVTFTVGVSNSGPDTAQLVTVADVLLAGVTFVSASASQGAYNAGSGVWTVGALSSGASATVAITVTVTTHLAITNTATASTATYDTNGANDAASATVDVPDADLAVAKVVDDPTPDLATNVTFTVTVANNGPNTAQGVAVADALPAGLTFVSASTATGSYNSGTGTWTIGALNNGATATLDIVATVSASVPIANTATASASTHDPAPGNNTATASLNARRADLAVTKTVNDGTPALGANVTFTVTVTNNGPDTASGVTVADALPAGLTLVSATPSVGSYSGGAWTVGSLANTASATLSLVATVTTDLPVTNTATVSATTSDANGANNSGSASVDVPDADLAVGKTVSDPTPQVGSNVTFTITLTNNGPDDATGVAVADALPAGLTLVSAAPSVGSYAAGVWSVGNLANGGSTTLDIVATVATHLAVTNTATASTITHDPVGANNGSSVSVDARDADLALTKSVNNPTPALGSNVTFTVTVANRGPDAAQGVAVADALPAGLTFVSATPSAGSYASGTGVWSVGTLAGGATATLDIVATVATHTAVTNTAVVTATTFDPTPGDHTDSATVNAPDADLTLSKSVDNPTPQLGDTVVFTLDLTNNGPDTTTGVSVQDLLPVGLTFVSASGGSYNAGTGIWSVGSLASGTTASLTVSAQVTAAATITNTATADSLLPDPNPGDNSASATVVARRADIAVTKTVDNPTPTVGGNVTFTVTVTNNGPNAAQATSVADALPAGLALVSATASTGAYASGVWTVGSLANGASATLQIVATVTGPSAVTNNATGSSSTFDPNSANNSASVTVDAVDADLAVTKTVDDPTPSVGATVTFLVTVSNNGPDSAAGVVVADPLPAGLTLLTATPSTGSYTPATGTWTIGSLASGAGATLAVAARVTVQTPVTNTAAVSTTTVDPVSGNNAASVAVDARDADLNIAKSVDNATPAVGGAVTFTVTVTNNGPDAAQGVAVLEALPAGLTFVSATPSVGTYNPGTGLWTVGTVANAAIATLDVVATVTSASPVTNTADVTSTTFDPTSGDHSASVTVDARDADLTLSKSVDDATPQVGQNVVFTLSVTNNGPDTANGVAVQDQLPAGLAFVSASSLSYNSITGAWPVGSLANGATATLTITATATDHLPVTNTASVSASTFDPATGNNTDSAGVNARDADLAVTKTVDDATPAFGANVVFTVTVANNGPDAAAGVVVSDPLPAGLAFVSSATVSGGYSNATGLWTIGSLPNAATATLTITARVDDAAAITNTATVSTSTADPVNGNDTDAATVDVAEADLAVTKTVDTPAPALNDTVRFTVTVTNNGPDSAAQVSVADALPGGLTLVAANPSVGTYGAGTWNVGTLANGATATLLVDARITVHTPVTNTATATTTTHDPNAANDTAAATVDVPNADLSTSKTVDNATPTLNGNVTFTVTVANSGPDPAAGVVVADALPAGLTLISANPSIGSYAAGVWTVGALANGTSETLTIVARVTASSPITNTATTSTSTLDTDGANNSASAAVDVADADLAVTKIVDNPSPPVGANVTFTVGVTNNGPNAATATVVTDALPAGLTFISANPSTGTYDSGTGAWSVGVLANGAGATLDIVARVTTSGGVTNTATVTAAEYDPVPSDNTASASVAGVQADLAVTKTVDDTTPSLGANVTFSVSVVNNGPDAAAAVRVDDLLPAGLTFVSAAPSVGAYNPGTGVWTVGALANGVTRTLDIVATVTVTTPITNVASATSTTFDPAAANNGDAALVDVQNADIAVTKTVDTPTPSLNGTVTYVVRATNNGPDGATGVTVDDQLPAGLTLVSATPSIGTYVSATGVWTIGALANGATADLDIVARVTTHTAVTNTASASSTTYDAIAANDSDSVTVNVPDANLGVNKSVDNAAPALGGNVTFTITVANAGPDAAAGVSVADALPGGLTYVSSTTTAGTYSNGTGIWTVGPLANGATATLDIVATVTTANAVTNTATVSSSTYDPAGPNSDSVTVDVPQADLAVSKTVDDPTPAPGGTVTFTVVVTNNGPDQAAGVAVADALPAGLGLVSASPSAGTFSAGTWTIGTLANGTSETLQVVAQALTSNPLTNTATASSTTFDPSGANNSDSATVNVADADLAVTKTVDDATPNLNANVHFTIGVTNNGPDPASGVTVADALPAGLTLVSASPSTGSYAGGVWTIGTLANGAGATLDITATVTSSATITNTATVASGAFDANPTNDTDSATVDAPDADLSVVKSVDDPTPSLNGTVTFLVAVTNNGPDAAPAVRVADALPAGLTLVSATPSKGTYAGGTWTVGALANGATETLAVVARVTSSALITNTATVTSGAADPTPSNDTGSASVDVPEADLGVTKTVDDPTPALNTDVTFTVTVTNNGPNPAFGVTVADALPSGLTLVSSSPSVGSYTGGTWTIGGLASGATATVDVTATVTSPAPITNTATVSSASFDGTPGNDTATATLDVPEADLAIQKTVSDPTPAMNGNVTFTLTVSNNGPSLAQAVQVTDALPAGLALVSASSPAYVGNVWTVGDLANGATATLDIVAQVVSPAAITNSATVTSSTLDPASANNTDTAQVDVPEADLRLTKTVDDNTPNEGQNIAYTLTLANNGPDGASAIDVTDVLPAQLTFVSAAPQAGTFSAGVWHLASLPSGVSRQLQIVARVDAQGIITNNAEVTASGTFDPTSTPGDGAGDDFATVDIDALPPEADLSLTKNVSSTTPAVGGSVTYTLTVRNAGPSPTTNVSVIDLLPAGVTYVSSTATQGSYDPGVGTWTIGTVPAGANVSLSIVATADQSGAILNTAEVGSSDATDPDSTPANAVPGEDDQASVQINVQGVLPASADLEIVKSASSPVANLGDTISYAIVVTNRGPATATNVQVLEQLPPPLRFVSARASVGAYALTSGVWSIPAIANGASASLIVTTHVVSSGSVTNTVQILSGDQPDPDGPFNPTPGGAGGEQSSATVSVAAPAPTPTRLGITKKGPKLVRAGGTVTFTVTVRNNGSVPATDVQMADCIPTGLSLRGKLTAGKLLKGRLSWRFGTLQPGQSRTIRVRFRVDRDTRGIRGCAAVTWGSNAPTVRALAQVRVVAGASRPTHTPVAG